MSVEQSSRSELVVLHAWRARLCARGLRESQERMIRAIAGNGLNFREALSIAHSMDAAIAMLRRTTTCLDEGSELRALADEVLAAFVRWRAAEPRTETSANAATRFGTLVRQLETLAAAESTPESALAPARANESGYPPDVFADSKKQKPASGFASLAALRDAVPEGPAEVPPPAAEAPRDPFSGKIVVARTRKGRGGKTVTMISGIRAGAARLDEIARELRQALGCGAVAEGDRIVVQGEQQARVRSFLESHGAGRIVMGT